MSFRVEGMFTGVFRVEDLDCSPRHVAYRGVYVCNRCGGEGHQDLWALREKFPKGIRQEEIEIQMKESIQRNHKCLLDRKPGEKLH